MTSSLNGIDAPLPNIDIDKINQMVSDTYDHIAPIYTKHHFNDAILSNPLETFDRLLKEQGKRTILDIGCGPGAEVAFFTARNFDVTGIDASSGMLDVARRKVSFGKFQQMKMHELQYREECFDAIWCARTLIHVPQVFLVDLLVTWKRVLKPEGIICASVILGTSNGWEQEEYDHERIIFNRYFAEGEIEQALEDAGYTILDTIVEEDRRDPSDCCQNHFIFAQKSASHLDQGAYAQFVEPRHDGQRVIVHDDHLESLIALHFKAGKLTSREKTNLCILYDRLAKRDISDQNRRRIAAWKLKLHLRAQDTLLSDDFDVWFTLGQLNLKLTQFKQAVICFCKANELQPGNLGTLLRLGYSYEGLSEFDNAITFADQARQIADHAKVSSEELGTVYHALGHFYVSRSHLNAEKQSIEDQEKGKRFMEQACGTENGHTYLSCLGSIYNETRHYTDTIQLIDRAIREKHIFNDLNLCSELHFVRAEAYMGCDRYEDALGDFDYVKNYARLMQDYDTLAHVELYEVRTSLKHNNVSELSLEKIQESLKILYKHDPSPYVVESFQNDREHLIHILSAFYRLKQCIESQEEHFHHYLTEALDYMEKSHDGKQPLHLLILADNVGTVYDDISKFVFPIMLHSFSEVEQNRLENEPKTFPVWGILVKGAGIATSTLANLSFLIGEAYEQGCTIYVYDPKHIFPASMREKLKSFFVDSTEDLTRFCYIMVLYDKTHEYLNSTRTALGMAPINASLPGLASQSENIDLLPL